MDGRVAKDERHRGILLLPNNAALRYHIHIVLLFRRGEMIVFVLWTRSRGFADLAPPYEQKEYRDQDEYMNAGCNHSPHDGCCDGFHYI